MINRTNWYDPKYILTKVHEDELIVEEWLDVPEYEGLYQVSSFGRVKSLERKDSIDRLVKEKILKQSISSVGYLIVCLFKESKQKTFAVHKLVAEVFLGHIPDGHKIVVDHDDNIKTNNFRYNLKLISQRENLSKDKKGYSSKYVGVSWYKKRNKWRASITINNKRFHLGYFINEEDAAKAYQEKLKTIN